MVTASESGTTVYATPSDCELSATRVFDAPLRLVWEAWTKPEHVSRWLLGPEGWTMPVCEIDLRSGGAWRYVWRKENGREMEMTGVYREVVPMARLVHTERWGPEWPESINAYDFVERAGRTTVTLTVTYPSKAVRDAAMETGMTRGIDVSFDRLDLMLPTLG